jgi:hypothetical protein
VGDSFTFGEQVSDWETWPAQLEELSRRRVINGGVLGYGMDQTFLRARRLLNEDRYSIVILSFISDDIRRCQMSVEFGGAKPYFDFKDGRLALKNVPVPLPARPSPTESGLLIVLEHSRLAHSVMSSLSPEWWLVPERRHQTQVLDVETGRKIACAVLQELEGLTKTYGSELIVLVQHAEIESSAAPIAVESALACLSDPGTRVIDLKPALSEITSRDLSRYNRMYVWRMTDEGIMTPQHMSAEGNQFVALEISKVLTQQARQPLK